MPRDRPRTGHSQAQTEEESQNELRMRELLNTLLDRFRRIALGIDTSSCPRLDHLCDRVGAECCRRQHTDNRNDSDNGYDGERRSEAATKIKKMCRHRLPV